MELSTWRLFLFLTLLSYTLTYIIKELALKKKIIDVPNQRSSHTTPTPRGGGLAIVITWYIFLLYLRFNHQIDKNLFYALISSILLVIIGLVDDIKNVSPKIRIVFQLLSGILGLYFLGGVKYIDFGFITIELPYVVNLIVLVLIIGFINVFNFLDGIDGYLGMETIFVFSALSFFSSSFIVLSFAFITLGFLIWNWPKAKIFCGDVGSTFIGYTLMIFTIYYQNTLKVSILTPIVLSGLFWIDSLITIYRRWKNNEKLSIPHKKHAYQRLNQSGYSHLKIVIIGMGINSLIFQFILLCQYLKWFLLPAFIMHFLLILIFIKFVDSKKAF